MYSGYTYSEDIIYENPTTETPHDETTPNTPVPWQDFIESQMYGTISQHVRAEHNGRIYDLLLAYYAHQNPSWPRQSETRVFVSEMRDDVQYLLHSINVDGRANDATGRLVLADVTFDGRKDVLVELGRSGVRNDTRFAALIYTNDTYVPNDSFSWIMNPVIDEEHQRIISTWRSCAATHGASVYVYDNGMFVATSSITIIPEIWGAGPYHNVYTWRHYVSRRIDDVHTYDVLFTGNAGLDEILAFFGEAATVHAPTYPPPLSLDQIQTAMQPYFIVSMWQDWEPTIIAAERVPHNWEYIHWEPGQMDVVLLNAARYRVIVRVREPLEEYERMVELFASFEHPPETLPFVRDGDYTIHTVYDFFYEINGVVELVVVFC